MQRIKFPRALPTREEKQTIAEIQAHKCAKCGEHYSKRGKESAEKNLTPLATTLSY